MSVLFIENHDSFSYNLIDYLKPHPLTPSPPCGEGSKPLLIRDHLEKPNLTGVSHLVLGPGPGSPKTSGRLMDWLHAGVQAKIPILGICLGHQAIGEYFGAKLARADRPVHGEAHAIHHTGTGLFKGVSNPTLATRYHSLILTDLPAELTREAWTETGEIMAIRHLGRPIFGLQFHPESFLSTHGMQILMNFTV